MSVLDSHVILGREAAYGTPAALTRAFEAMGDGHKRSVEYLESRGMRSAFHTTRDDRRRVINMGAAGDLTADVLDEGFGMLLRAMLGTSTIAQVGVTAAWLQTHQSDSEGPTGESLTVQYNRAPVTGAVIPKTYHGGKITSWELSQAVGANLSLKLAMDYEDEDKSTAAGVATYPSDDWVYGWPDLVVTIGGVAVDALDFSLKGDNGLKTDRRYLRGSVLKKEPIRIGLPSYEGMLSVDYEDDTHYDRFVAGSIHPVVATWTGPVIEGANTAFLKATLPAVQFIGETPQSQLDNLPVQPLPFKVLHNGTDPAVTLEYQSTDIAF